MSYGGSVAYCGWSAIVQCITSISTTFACTGIFIVFCAEMGSEEKWYFTKEQLENSPSRQCGIDSQKERSYRQQAANFIQDLGQRLKVSQLCINTAIVYMHRFYVFHSFTHFPWNSIAAAALFLAAKVEEQPRKVEHVIRFAYHCRNRGEINSEITPEKFQMLSQDLVFNENILLQTLGFDVAIDHPHTHIVKCCHLVRAGKDLAQTSYFMASNSLHLTTMCLQYKPTVVACFCIHLASKWSRWEIPLSNEQKEWFSYVDPTVTTKLLEQLTEEFLVVFDQCPSRLKEKILSIGGNRSSIEHHWAQNQNTSSPFDDITKKGPGSPDGKEPHAHRPPPPQHHGEGKSGVFDDPHKQRSSRPHEHGMPSIPQNRDREKERKERERLAQQHGGMKPHPSHSNPSSSKQPVPHHYHRSEQKRPPVPGEYIRDPAKKEMSHQLVRSDKDVQKRDYLLKPDDYLLKPHVTDNTNSLSNYPESRSSYPRPSSSSQGDPNKKLAVRRHDEMYNVKSEVAPDRQKQASAVRDKNGAYVKSSSGHPQQKVKPYPEVLKPPVGKVASIGAAPVGPKPEIPYNGQTSTPVPLIQEERIKLEAKEEVFVPPVKKPSLFSPEKSPPYKKPPPAIKLETPTTSSYAPLPSDINKRPRTSSSTSEPELRPVMKKIDQQEGYENLIRDSTIGINKLHQVPDIITPITDIKTEKISEPSISKEMRPPDLIPPFSSAPSQPLVNGIETNPTLISNLLKETPTVPHLPAVAATVQLTAPVSVETKDKDHHHKERKQKKNKEKHKHKDKDRSKDDKEKKKKHKDKDREKHKNKEKKEEEVPVPVVTQPIKITIHKDKIQPPESPSLGLKIKIPKDRIKTESIAETPPQTSTSSGSLKIKIPIPKESMNNFAPVENKKRDRDRTSPVGAPPAKVSKTSYGKYGEPKQNGRHSHGKVA